MSKALEIHDQLYAEYMEQEEHWTSIGFPPQAYQIWLESMVIHFKTCALARFRDDVYVYSEHGMIDNLQETVNKQQAEIAELKQQLGNIRLNM